MASSHYPQKGGWTWLYNLYDRTVRPHPWLHALFRSYFRPKAFEKAGNGRIYRLLGVGLFGKVIPTGGVQIRRLTGARMAPYTLRGTSLRGAWEFRYRTCAFEAAHTLPMIALMALTVYWFAEGETRLGVEDLLVNLLVNIYPIMHHRHTRVRIDTLLSRAHRRRIRD